MSSFIASKKFGIIYVNIPKSACTSIKCWLYRLDYGIFPEQPLDIHRNIRNTNSLPNYHIDSSDFDIFFRNSFVFTFVRHPLIRAYSLYNEKIANIGKYSFPQVRNILASKYDADFHDDRTIQIEQHNFLCFLNFIKDNKVNKLEFRKDPHWMPQSRLVRQANKIRTIDFIGRVENITKDFEYIYNKINVNDIALPQYNEGPRSPFSYRQIITKDILNIGSVIYNSDLFNFAYKIDYT